jgi:hypothetical protein
MERALLVVLILVLVVAFAVAAAMRWPVWHRRRHTQVEPGHVEPRPLVRVLESREELEDAVRRAAAFERGMAAVLELRACRYEALLERPADIVALPDRPLDPPSETAAEQPLSA